MLKLISCLCIWICFALITTGSVLAQWIPGDTTKDIRCLAALNGNLFAGTRNTGVFRSSDYGATWTAVNTGLPFAGNFIYTLTVCGNSIFAGVYGVGLYRSSDNGDHWAISDSGISNTNFQCSYVEGSTMYIGTFNGAVFRSNDTGAIWDDMRSLPTAVYSLITHDGLLFCGTKLGVFISPDSGSTWIASDSGLPQNFVNAFAVLGNDVYLGTSLYGVFKTTNDGVIWDSTNTGLTTLGIYAFDTIGSDLIAGTSYGIFLSSNGGASWVEADTGLNLYPNSPIGIGGMINLGGYVLVGLEGDGVFHRPASDFGVSSVAQTQPEPTLDIQTYPNPFSQSTTITFTSQGSGYADVSIVNPLGTEVAKLYSGELGNGEHSFIWGTGGTPALQVANGMYECLVRMNGAVQSAGIVLLR